MNCTTSFKIWYTEVIFWKLKETKLEVFEFSMLWYEVALNLKRKWKKKWIFIPRQSLDDICHQSDWMLWISTNIKLFRTSHVFYRHNKPHVVLLIQSTGPLMYFAIGVTNMYAQYWFKTNALKMTRSRKT